MTTPDNPLIDAARGRDEKPEALKVATMLRGMGANRFICKQLDRAADELERQHARIAELEAQQARNAQSRDCLRPECMSRGCFGHCIQKVPTP